MAADARRVAREAKQSPALRALARAGYAANGVVHALIGVIVLVVAFGGDGETDPSGAFVAIAAAPLGFIALWLLAVTLGALGLWHLVAGIAARGESAAKTWGLRASEWGQAVVFVVLGVLAASVALGARPDSDRSAEEASRGVLVVPGGVFVLAAAGIGIGIAGIAFVVIGVRRGFEKKMSLPAGGAGSAVRVLGVIGYVAKGVSLAIVGVLLVVAAVRLDPSAAGGLDAAISSLLALPFGPWLVGAVGVGFLAYGVFCGFRARYAKL